MRILFCNYEYPPLGGGGGVVMAAMARELARRHEVTVLTSRAAGLAPFEDDRGVSVVRVPVLFHRQLAVANLPSMAAYLPMGLIEGLRLARRRRFDVVNTHFVVPTGPLGDWLARRLQIPNVLSVHGGDLFDPSKALSPHRHGTLRRAIARLLRRADAVVAQSRDTATRVREIYGETRPVELVPLGIERPPPVEGASRAAFGLDASDFVLATVGRVVPRKATGQLVRLVAALRDARSKLLVVGDGPEVPALAQLAHTLGVAQRVRLLGHVSEQDKCRALAVSDVFVSTSQHEGFGLVFLEAMAFGLPIVCYDRGGQTDFLRTPVSGYTVPLNDFRQLLEAVRALRDAPERRARIARANLAAVEDYFIDRCAARYETLFERACLERAAGAAAALQR